jgi:uncharacterized cupin superfamily protein
MAKLAPASVPEVIGSRYPPPFDAPCRQRGYRRLGAAAGLTRLGVSLVRLPPGAWSSQRHWHALEDEFLYVVSGEVLVASDAGEEPAGPGDCFAWPAGVRDGHCVKNAGTVEAVLLVASSSDAADHGEYPELDLVFTPDGYRRRDGSAFE